VARRFQELVLVIVDKNNTLIIFVQSKLGAFRNNLVTVRLNLNFIIGFWGFTLDREDSVS
jgi:hypothetical protein